MKIQPNCVYVIPPNVSMTMADTRFRLVPRSTVRAPHMPIDYFFRSLASAQHSKAIAVILSGTASDGALGIEAIKGEGGITFVQDDRTAKFPGMPRSAIGTGSVDFILPVEKIADELVQIGKHPYLRAPAPAAVKTPETEEAALGSILRLLYRATDVDFALYKPTTVRRRIMRRMSLHRLEHLPEYLKMLKQAPDELDALYRDILIKVTGFFRDPEAFEALRKIVFPAIMRHHGPGKAIRIWVPGCATGEEVYSIAICLLEFLGDKTYRIPIQIFATDIDEEALNKARIGQYLENIAQDVSPERLRRFFTKVEAKYQINKNIRDICVFAKQNLLKDPPFSNLDLISCRNVLIYLGPQSHKSVVPLFHYALKPTGFLLLGSSEMIGTFSELFGLADKRHKIYSKTASSGRPRVLFEYRAQRAEYASGGDENKQEVPAFREADLMREAERLLLNAYAPPAVLINDQMEVLQFRGDTSKFLTPPPGRASFDVIRMAREGLMVELRKAIQEARKKQAQVTREEITIRQEGGVVSARIQVIPLKYPAAPPFYVVIFEEQRPSKASRPAAHPARPDRAAERKQSDRLKEELSVTKQHLQSIIEEYEAANEELKSANEEILSTNEELQSTNEELETAKEELQSTNEELTTMNEEMQNRNRELAQSNNDLQNLLASANLALVVLGRDLRIRIITPQAEKLLKLKSSDIGRPITDMHLGIDIPGLDQLISDSIENVRIRELKLPNLDGLGHTVWVRPYKTSDNRIDGAVMVFVPTEEVTEATEALEVKR